MFCRDDWDRVATRYEAWWAGRGDIFAVTARRSGSPPPVDFSRVDPLEKFFNPKYRIARVEDQIAHTYYGGDAFARAFVNLGPGIVAAYLGSPVRAAQTTVWFDRCLESWDDRALTFDPDNQWWRRTVGMTEALCRIAGGRFCVSFTDLGGVYDILASLRGTEGLLTDMADVPDAVERAADRVTEVWLRCYDELCRVITRFQSGTASWDGTWSPGRMYCPQSDVSAMIGPADFRKHDVPRLRCICAAMDHVVYHLDGPDAVRHLDALMEIPQIDAVQWVQGAGNGPTRDWLPLLTRIQDGGKGVQCHCGPEEIDILLRELRPEGRCIVCAASDEDQARRLEESAGTSR